MRIGLLTDGGHPYPTGETGRWCDRLVRGLARHEFDIYALGGGASAEGQGLPALPPQVRRVLTATPQAPAGRRPPRRERGEGRGYGRRERQAFVAHFGRLAAAICADDPATPAASGGEDFADGLYGLAALARDHGGLAGELRSETAVRILEGACRAPGANRAVRAARVPDHLAFASELERALRPLSLDWYGDDTLGSVDLSHAASGGRAALPGLLAKRFCGVPLLVTEYGVQLRAHYLTGSQLGAPARALRYGFERRLAAEVYTQAELITPGNAHTRRWQERCGADRAKLRTVHPGLSADRFHAVGEGAYDADPGTLVWVGRAEPAKDIIALLHAFAEVRKAEPGARLRLFAAPARDAECAGYLAHCRALAAHLFPDEATGAHAVGDNPVSFEEIGGPEAPGLADAYATASVVVLSSVVEGFPLSLVEAMFCGRATVSTDTGAVVEVIGGTGLVVPPRNPRALADACLALLRDPERRARLGAAARARALELFTVEQNLAAFRGIYLELMSHNPVRRESADGTAAPQPFAHPAEAHVPGRWAAPAATRGPMVPARPAALLTRERPAAREAAKGAAHE
ncbi:glycosyltransferase [Streptomyces sp. Edi4]|uniref:glycosyltransferase n=1 Tax=Streptomyces sp. Edi4 TaxID=3162527 RepID=UPI00330690D0